MKTDLFNDLTDVEAGVVVVVDLDFCVVVVVFSVVVVDVVVVVGIV